MKSSDNDQKFKLFLQQLDHIAWFANLGEQIPTSKGIPQIFDWSDWPGPEEPSITELSLRQQTLHDELIDAMGPEANQFWDQILAKVIQGASRRVPYDSNCDTWHAPTAAVWHAAWTAGLMGLCILAGRAIPHELESQWQWFVVGHWPCDCADEGPNSDLIVY